MTLQCCACHGTRPGSCDCACHDHDNCKLEISRLQAELAEMKKHLDYALPIAARACQIEKDLEQAKAQQIHCAACGGVECHRLAEIVKLTGMESDQHLVEWVSEAKERERQLREACEEGRTAINNLVTSGHESLLLRKHPEPCRHLDFCVVSDAMRRYAIIEAALTVPPADEKEAWLDGMARVAPEEKP